MKTKLTVLKFLVVSCGIYATTAVFGQTVRTWTGGDGTGTNLGAATNWSGGVLPGNGDTAQWDGTVPGNLVLTYNGGIGGNFQVTGCSYSLAASQTGNVSIVSPVVASANLAFDHITNSSPAGSLIFGDTTANVLNLIERADSGGPPYLPHYMLNNSTGPIVINKNVRFQSGGGNVHILTFGGSGNWFVTNNLVTANGVGTTIVKVDGGTFYWNGPSIGAALGNSGINSPIDIEGGTLVLMNNTVLSASGVGTTGTQSITNNATFVYDASGLAQTLTGIIRGTGLLRVNNGTLTLSGASTYSGNTSLNGGTLVVSSAENLGTSGPLGIGGTISFAGGTLQFSAGNTYDYSPRFSTAASQAYSINTGGQSVTLTNALTSSGGTLTKLGSGTLTLAGANTYSGTTSVGGGTLVLQNTAGTGAIVVSNSTVLGVAQGGTQIAPSTLTVGTSSSATLEFNNVNSTTTEAIAAGTISAGGTITVNVNSGSFLIGQSYPLFSWGSGTPPPVTLGTLTGALGNLSTNGTKIQLNITGLAYVWTGNTDGNWDTTTANNWKVNGVPQIFANGSSALFDDTATGQTNVTLNAAVSPAGTTVNSSAKIYSITSSGANLIGGTGGLTKNGSSTLTLSGGVNTYSGATTIANGTLSISALANGGSASDIGASGNSAANLVLNGGTLQYTNGGAVDSDRLFTLGLGNGTIDASGTGALNLTNTGSVALSGSGPRTLTLKGSDADGNTLAASLSDNSGATGLAKSGTGKWILAGNNTISGAVTIAGGTLQVGTGGANGALGSGSISDNGSLIFNTSSTLTNGTISGSGTVTLNGSGTVVLPGDNSYAGATTINAGTLQIGNGGATGKITTGAGVVNNGLLIFNSTGDFNYAGFFAVISGSGNLIKRGSGLLQMIGNNTYTGWTLIDPGASLQICQGNQGANASSAITNNGTLIVARQDNGVFFYNGLITGTGSLVQKVSNGNAGDVALTGTNDYTGNTYILGGGLILGDNGTTPYGGSIIGDVFMTNDYVHNQFGTPPNDFVPASIIFNRKEDYTFGGNITGNGFVVVNGTGTVKLTGNITHTGGGTQTPTTINAGTLLINGTLGAGTVVVNAGTLGGTGTIGGPVNVTAAGTLAPGASVGTLTIVSNLTIAGNLVIEVNRSVSPSNDVVVVGGTLNNTGVGNTLTVTNLGPALVAGDKFTLFNKPVANGSALTVTGGGMAWINNLEVDGSITAVKPTLNFTQNGGNLDISWSGSFKLIAQTNSLNVGISNNWADYPGGGSSPVTVPIDATQGTVFFGLAPTP